ncbi:MAG: hypothetical protein AAGF90_14585 [Pseudomonadota bacterium]
MARFLLTWIAAFALVTAIFAGLDPILSSSPVWLRSLVVSGLMVLAMQRLIGPAIARVLG